MMRSETLWRCIVPALALTCSPLAHGASLDQSSFSYGQGEWFPQTGPVGAWNTNVFPEKFGFVAQAQTFTAGSTGQLDAVGVHLQSFIDVSDPLFLAIRTTDSGIPAAEEVSDLGVTTVGADFYQVGIAGISWGDVRRVDLGHLGIKVVAGSTYAIVLYSSAAVPSEGPFVGYGAPYGWDGVRTTGQYEGGRAYSASQLSANGAFAWVAGAEDHDHFFQTFVSPHPIPEPRTSFMLAVGLSVLFGASLASRLVFAPAAPVPNTRGDRKNSDAQPLSAPGSKQRRSTPLFAAR